MSVIASGTCPSPYPLPAPVQAGLVQRAGRGMKGACAFYATLGLTGPISREQSSPIHLEQRRLNCSVPRSVVGLGFLSRESRANIDLAFLGLLNHPRSAVGGDHRGCILRNGPIFTLETDADGTIQGENDSAQIRNRPTALACRHAYRLSICAHQLNLQV